MESIHGQIVCQNPNFSSLYYIFKKVTIKGSCNVYESYMCYFPVFHCILYVCDQFYSAVSLDSHGCLAKWFQCKRYNPLSSLILVHLHHLQKWTTICLRLSTYDLPWFGYNVTLTSKFWVCTLLPGRLQIYDIDEPLSTQFLAAVIISSIPA